MMKTLDLTNTGKFSSRAGELFSIILDENGQIELSMGLGSRGDKLGIMIVLNDSFSTVFLPKEAKALIEIITQTNAEEEPYSPQVKKVMHSMVARLNDLVAQADKIEQSQIERKLNAKRLH